MPTTTPDVLGRGLTVTVAGGRSIEYANLDYAATAPCLAAAADAVNELLPWYASVHRGAGAASQRCTLAYERARQTVGDFIGARPDDLVIFTRNTTDGLNLLARAVPTGTTVVGWGTEHHANLLPWSASPAIPAQPLAASPDTAVAAAAWAGGIWLPAPRSPEDAVCDLESALTKLHGPVLVTVTGASNVTGEVWPVAELTKVAHAHGARICVDAAQLAPHRPVSLAESDVDYLALSGHKLYAPFGTGVLAGRADWLEAAEPYLSGGGASANVCLLDGAGPDVRWQPGPARHEAGTPNLFGAVALAAACEAIAAADRDALAADESALVARLRAGLAELPDVAELRTFDASADRVGIVSFAVAGVPAPLVAQFLSTRYGIGVRDGLFCAHPLTRGLLREASDRLGEPLGDGAVRASLGLGTRPEYIERLICGLRELSPAAIAESAIVAPLQGCGTVL
jgi:selenocysteine lyase/cysteine desulfurase